jgi:hypothetical protein
VLDLTDSIYFAVSLAETITVVKAPSATSGKLKNIINAKNNFNLFIIYFLKLIINEY